MWLSVRTTVSESWSELCWTHPVLFSGFGSTSAQTAGLSSSGLTEGHCVCVCTQMCVCVRVLCWQSVKQRSCRGREQSKRSITITYQACRVTMSAPAQTSHPILNMLSLSCWKHTNSICWFTCYESVTSVRFPNCLLCRCPQCVWIFHSLLTVVVSRSYAHSIKVSTCKKQKTVK